MEKDPGLWEDESWLQVPYEADLGADPVGLLPRDELSEGYQLPGGGPPIPPHRTAKGVEHPPGTSSVPGAPFHTHHVISPHVWEEPSQGPGSCPEGQPTRAGQTTAPATQLGARNSQCR